MRMIERPILREYLFFTPDKLGGEDAYQKVCATTGLKPFEGGYGVLLLASAESEQRATLVTWDVAWTEAIAEVQQQAAGGQIAREAGGVDLTPELLRSKVVALYQGWPDEWDGRSPDGFIVADYRGDTPHSRDRQ
ncbi:hypothetical protein GCM10010411_89590 [Actinomadura fulvescens]|uniref:Uncharacterized protein n=2 Tax=Actinomadura fulvescens TaxID=46160 RepID=A0ABP6D5K8_9ACTN